MILKMISMLFWGYKVQVMAFSSFACIGISSVSLVYSIVLIGDQIKRDEKESANFLLSFHVAIHGVQSHYTAELPQEYANGLTSGHF